MNNLSKDKKNKFEVRESILLEALDNIRQRAMNELYETDKRPSDIIREIVDSELLDLETADSGKR